MKTYTVHIIWSAVTITLVLAAYWLGQYNGKARAAISQTEWGLIIYPKMHDLIVEGRSGIVQSNLLDVFILNHYDHYNGLPETLKRKDDQFRDYVAHASDIAEATRPRMVPLEEAVGAALRNMAEETGDESLTNVPVSMNGRQIRP